MLKKYGRVNILVNCAGGNQKGATVMPKQSFFQAPLDAFDKVMALNFKGTVLCCQVFGEAISLAPTGGSIVNISSMSAQLPLTRVCGYSAAKAAVDNLTRWLSTEFAKK